VLKVIVIVPETSLLVVFGCEWGCIIAPNFSFVMGWVGSVSWWVDWAGSKKMDPRTSWTTLTRISVVVDKTTLSVVS